MEYWYKYRDNLFKKVVIYSPHEQADKRPYDAPFRTDEGRTADNIRRAQRQIEAYALCNEWNYFGTFTLSPRYGDRGDLDAFRRDFMQFIRDERKRTGSHIRFLLVPELHKNSEGWHLHGLLNGFPSESLRAFTLREKLPKYLRDKLKDGERIFDWPDYQKRFGWVDLEPLRCRDAAARYITKYITKDVAQATSNALQSGRHLYFLSRGLQSPEQIESAPEWESEARPDLVKSSSYKWDYGEVHWYEV